LYVATAPGWATGRGPPPVMTQSRRREKKKEKE